MGWPNWENLETGTGTTECQTFFKVPSGIPQDLFVRLKIIWVFEVSSEWKIISLNIYWYVSSHIGYLETVRCGADVNMKPTGMKLFRKKLGSIGQGVAHFSKKLPILIWTTPQRLYIPIKSTNPKLSEEKKRHSRKLAIFI